MPLPSHRPILLLLDWDSTLTTTSTLPLIASLATLPTIHPQLPHLSHSYTLALRTHAQTYRPNRHERTSPSQELAYLDSLGAVERDSIRRLEAEGLFRDVGEGKVDVESLARDVVRRRDVRLRRGWEELCARVQEVEGGKVGVISVAWSGRFIRGVLVAQHAATTTAAAPHDVDDDDSSSAKEGGLSSTSMRVVNLKDVDIRANEIAGGDDRSGRVEGGIHTAGDKRRVMADVILAATTTTASTITPSPTTPAIRDTHPSSSSSSPSSLNSPTSRRIIYIGDSPTDLSCLLAADVGICIRDTPMTGEQRDLAETLERVGVECVGVGRFGDGIVGVEEKGEEEGGGRRRRRLYWAGDFEEVVRSGVVD